MPNLFEEFSGTLIGNQTECESHLIARLAFLDRLRTDPTVDALFHSVAEAAGLATSHQAASEALDHLALLVGMERQQLFASGFRVSSKHQAGVFTASMNAEKRMAEFGELVEASAGLVAERMLRFVRDGLELPWPWLYLELIRMLYFGLCASLCRIEYTVDNWIEPPPIHAISVPFTTGPEESASDALKSLDRFYEMARALILKDRRRPRMPDEDKIQEDVDWFYRHKIRNESQRSLALIYRLQQKKTKPKSSGDNSRSTIRSRIERAERLLGGTLYRFS